MGHHLEIAYQLGGRKPGYAYVPPTEGFDEGVLRAVWRDAMPRGQGWGEYIGARSLKCFQVERRIMAVSDVVVTDQVDESGRQGIRHATITLVPIWRYADYLRSRLDNLPDAHHKMTLARWMRVIERMLPKLQRKRSRVVLAYTYDNPEQWRIIEALVMTLATSWGVRTFGGSHIPITTLALTHRDETRIVALPREKAAQVSDLPVIDLT